MHISLSFLRSETDAHPPGWLSPELYLRRPPVRNEQYRLDRMLQAAAQRGVKVNIIVYKEVTQALTRKYPTRMSLPSPMFESMADQVPVYSIVVAH